MRYIRTKDGKLFDLKKIEDEIKNDETYNVFYRDYKFEKPKPFNGYGGRGLIINYTYKGKRDVSFIKENKTYNSCVYLECDPDGYTESDDLTTLFDTSVVDRHDGYSPYPCNLVHGIYFRNEGVTVYGAIWTEWGLKYVAKMNDKGEFELL